MSKKSGGKKSAMQRLSETIDTMLCNVDTKRKKVSPTTKNKACKKLRLKPNPTLSFLQFKQEESNNITCSNSIDIEQPSTSKQRLLTKKWVPPIVKKHDNSFENIENVKKWRNHSIDKEKSEFGPIEHLKMDLHPMKNNQISSSCETQLVKCSQYEDNDILVQESPNNTEYLKDSQVTTMTSGMWSKTQEIMFNDSEDEISSTLQEAGNHPRLTDTILELSTNCKEPELDLSSNSISSIDKNIKISVHESSDHKFQCNESNCKKQNNCLNFVAEETNSNNNIYQTDKFNCTSLNDQSSHSQTCDETIQVCENSQENTGLYTNDTEKIDLTLDEDNQTTVKEVLTNMVHENDVEDEIEDMYLTCKTESDLSTNFNSSIDNNELQEIIDDLNTTQGKVIALSTKELSTDDESKYNSPSKQPSKQTTPNSQHSDGLQIQKDIDNFIVDEPIVNLESTQLTTTDESTLNNPPKQLSQINTLKTNYKTEDDVQSQIDVMEYDVDEKYTNNVENEGIDIENSNIEFACDVANSSNDGNEKNEEMDTNVELNILQDVNNQSDAIVVDNPLVSITQNESKTNAVSELNVNEVSNGENIETTYKETEDDSLQTDVQLNDDALNNESPIVVIEVNNNRSTAKQSSDEDIAKQNIYKDLIECSDDFYNLPMSQFISIENDYKENIINSDGFKLSSNSETDNNVNTSKISHKNQTTTCPLGAEVNKTVNHPLPPVPRLDWLRRTQDEKQKLRSVVQEINSLNSMIEQCRKEIWPQFLSKKK